jgi:hypothetical protein
VNFRFVDIDGIIDHHCLKLYFYNLVLVLVFCIHIFNVNMCPSKNTI